jgi:hypothetical protein
VNGDNLRVLCAGLFDTIVQMVFVKDRLDADSQANGGEDMSMPTGKQTIVLRQWSNIRKTQGTR